MNDAFFGKAMRNVKKHRDIKIVTIEKWRNCLVSGPNYHAAKLLFENLLTTEMKKHRHLWIDLSI